jgi:hypothetical protein
MKKSLSIISLCASVIIFAQIGINTDQPKATLDVTAKRKF